MTKLVASASLVRPADTNAYASGDLVANAVAANAVAIAAIVASTAPGAALTISRVRLAKSGPALDHASFRVHLFTGKPATGGGDNAALAIAGIAAGYVGNADITMDQSFTDGAFGAVATSLVADLPAGQRNLYAVIEARDVFVPTGPEKFTVTVETDR